MKIPNRFKLMGQTIDVRYSNTLIFDDESFGKADYNKNEIILQADCPGVPRQQSQIEKTFYHELVHCILFFLNDDEKRKDEKFVDNIAQLLHQAFITMEF